MKWLTFGTANSGEVVCSEQPLSNLGGIMSLLNKFIDSLQIRFLGSAFREVIHPFAFQGRMEQHNVIYMLNKGHLSVGPHAVPVSPGDFYFFPAGQQHQLRFGSGRQTVIGPEGFAGAHPREEFLRDVSCSEDFSQLKELYTEISFEVLLYNAIPFFEILQLPAIPMPADLEFGHLIRYITQEQEQNKLGRDKIISNYMEEIIIHLCRYIDSQARFRPYVERLEFLADRRLVDIVKYIQGNLEKDLSNKVIANIAYVSEDYVGQFFKSLTGQNLQDYIENQRLERAMQLLRTQPDNIQEIAHRVGFKDPAYFSRRFKLKFNANANSIRQFARKDAVGE